MFQSIQSGFLWFLKDSGCIPFGLLPIMLEIPIKTREDLFDYREGAQKSLIQQVFLKGTSLDFLHHLLSGDWEVLGLNPTRAEPVISEQCVVWVNEWLVSVCVWGHLFVRPLHSPWQRDASLLRAASSWLCRSALGLMLGISPRGSDLTRIFPAQWHRIVRSGASSQTPNVHRRLGLHRLGGQNDLSFAIWRECSVVNARSNCIVLSAMLRETASDADDAREVCVCVCAWKIKVDVLH